MPSTGTPSQTPGTAPSSGKDDRRGWFGVANLIAGYGGPAAVRQVTFAVEPGTFLTLLGPSGCGKSTLLKVIGGYLAPLTGKVHLDGRDITRALPEARNIGMVFQSYALFPHLSARRNVAFGLEVRGVPRADRDRRVEDMLDRVGLSAAERDRTPAALSGGQQQRVALARALVIEPAVLLLDEPLANLDRRLRDQLRAELRRLQRETGVTTVMVTHDQEEALAVSDLVGVMAAGRLLQFGPPVEVYHRPRTPFVARFLGEANLIDGTMLGRRAGDVCLVRPEGCRLGPGDDCRWRWPGVVAAVSFLGADVLAEVKCEGGLTWQVRSRGEVRSGDRVMVGVPDDAVWVIPDADP